MNAEQPGTEARLVESRAHLRLALSLNQSDPPDTSTRPTNYMESLLALQTRLDGLANLCSVVANATVAPLARKHPWGLVAGAFVAGGVLVFIRPWRWASGPALAARLLPPAPPPAVTALAPVRWSELVLPLLQQVFIPRK